MKTDVTLFEGSTSIVIVCNTDPTRVLHSLQSIFYKLKDFAFDSKLKKFVVANQYFHYSRQLNRAIIPIAYKENLLNIFASFNVTYTVIEIINLPRRYTSFKMKESAKDKPGQKEVIDFLVNNNSKMRCLALQTGCLAADTEIRVNRGGRGFGIPIIDMEAKFNNHWTGVSKPWNNEVKTNVRSYNEELGQIRLNEVEGAVDSGIQALYRLTLENGLFLLCTDEHFIKTFNGWKMANECVGEDVMWVESDDQIIPFFSKCISFEYEKDDRTFDLMCKYPHNNFVANGMVVHNSGKTYCAIKAAIKIGSPFLIISSGLTDQWIESVKLFTNLEDDDIYLIQGNKSIRKLMSMEHKPSCIIASLETIRDFAQQKEVYFDFEYSFADLVEHLGIHTKIVDECHMNFFSIVSIDLVVNVPVNIYLSATYSRRNPSTKKIFDTVFPKEKRHGEGVYHKYANITLYKYSSRVPEQAFNLGSGYAHYKYEDYFFRKPERLHWFMTRIIKPIIDEKYLSIRKPGQKALILMGKVVNIDKTIEKLKEIYPHLVINPYVYKSPENNILEADIIISTIGSAGTGKDIKGLLMTLLTVSIGAPNLVAQVLGRLREIIGSEVQLCDIYNDCCEAHKRHVGERELEYISKGKTFTKRNI